MGNWLGDNYFELGVAIRLQQVMLNHTRLRLAFKGEEKILQAPSFSFIIFWFRSTCMSQCFWRDSLNVFFSVLLSDQICKTEYKHVSQIYQLL